MVALEEAGGLLAKEAYPHKYPYDWRTKKPTIFRATDQWFASVDRFRETALDAINKASRNGRWCAGGVDWGLGEEIDGRRIQTPIRSFFVDRT